MYARTYVCTYLPTVHRHTRVYLRTCICMYVCMYVGTYLGMDGRIHHDPGSATQLSIGRDVDEDGLLEGHQGVHDHRAELEHLQQDGDDEVW